MQSRRWYTYFAWAYLAVTGVGFGLAVFYTLNVAAMGLDMAPDPESRAWVARRVAPDGPAQDAGLGVGDRILSIRDRHGWISTPKLSQTRTAQTLTALPGDTFVLTVERDGGTDEITVTLGRRLALADRDFWRGVSAQLAVLLLYLVVGGVLILLRPGEPRVLLLGMFLIAVPGIAWPTPDRVTGLRELLLLASLLRNWILLTTIVHFALIFPEPLPQLRRRPWAFASLYLLFLPLFLFNSTFWVALAYGIEQWFDPSWATASGGFGMGYLVLYVLAAAAILFYQYRLARLEDYRRRLRVILLGFCASFVVLVGVGVTAYLFMDPDTVEATLGSQLGIFTLFGVATIFPLSVVYAVVKHRMFGVRVILRAGLRYALARRVLLVLLAIPLLSLAYQLGRQGLDQLASPQSWRLAPLVLLLIGAAVLRERILNGLDRRFFREAYDTRRVLLNLVDRLRLAGDQRTLIRTLEEGVGKALHPETIRIYRRENGVYRVPGSSDEALTNGLVEHLEQEARALRVGGTARRVARKLDEDDFAFIRAAGAEVLIPVRYREGRLQAVLMLGPKKSGEPYSREDVELTVSAASQFAAALETQRLEGEVLFRREAEERLLREIELAQEVQARLLPENPPEMDGLDIAGMCLPARIVGGDYYDFLTMDGGRLGLAVADVSGKGLSAAMLMSNLQAGLRTAVRAGVGVEEAMRAVNGLLCELTTHNRFASFFFGVVDRERSVLLYLNAGHDCPVVLHRGASDVTRLTVTAPILGVFDKWRGDEQSIELRAGDTLVAFTDGLSEANDPSGEELGEDRIIEAARAGVDSGADARGIARGILDAAERFAAGTAYADDLTLAVIRILER